MPVLSQAILRVPCATICCTPATAFLAESVALDAIKALGFATPPTLMPERSLPPIEIAIRSEFE